MKKKLLSILVVAMCVFGFTANVNAEVVSDDLASTLKDEINTYKDNEAYNEYVEKFKSVDTSLYKSDENKINVYVFRGSTCGYCLRAISFFTDILDEYGKYFNLVTYEVWENSDNSALMEEVADALNENPEGVPFIVIGDKVFGGYDASFDEDIKKTIKEAYDNKDSDYQDVVASVIDGTDLKVNKNDSSTAITIIIILVVIAGVAFLVYMAKDTSADAKEEENLEEKNTTKQETVVKPKTTAKKTTTKKSTTTAAKKTTTAKKTSTAKKSTTTKKTTKK